MAIFVGLAGIVTVGFRYYTAPLGRRMRDPLHDWLKPSGAIGQTLGILAFTLFLFLWLYPLRKRLGSRARVGSVPRWLDVHIVAGLSVPFIAATHAGFRFTGLIGLGYASMFVVFLSGLVGRYLYVHIPRTRGGVEMTMDEVASERRMLVVAISSSSAMPPAQVEAALLPADAPIPTANPLRIVGGMVHDDLARRRAVRRFLRSLEAPRAGARRLDPATVREVVRLAGREVALAQQARMLDGIQRVFRHWHAAHKPFAITALIAVALHVGVAIAMGQTWFR